MAGGLGGWVAGWLSGWIAGWLDGCVAVAGWLGGWIGRVNFDFLSLLVSSNITQGNLLYTTILEAICCIIVSAFAHWQEDCIVST